VNYLLSNSDIVAGLAGEHLLLVLVAVAVAVAIGLPLGIIAHRVRILETPILSVTGLLYLIPSLALFAFLIPILGLGARPAIVALVLYSLLVIVRNAIAGLRAVPPENLDAAIGIGMSRVQQMWIVELPLGLPIIVAGIRVAIVMCVGIATIAAYIGAGGLGTLIFRGIATGDTDLIIAGAVTIAVIAIVLDAALRRLERFLQKS
jgi:osmoprotectant transport system permease protein